MRTKFYIQAMVLMAAFSCLCMPQKAFAAFSLSVRPNPYRGSDDLRFDTIDPTAGSHSEVLKIDITSDIGSRYELTQTVLKPLTNDALGVSIPDDNFIFYARSASTYGTLYYVEQDTVMRGAKNIYISNDQGTPDSFELVYVIKTPLDIPAGLYNGRITFILRPIGSSSQAQITKTLNIIAQVGFGESTIQMITARGTKTIVLNSAKEDMIFFDVLVNIKGGVGTQFRILQLAQQPFESPEGEELPYEAVNFLIREAKKGTGPTSALALSSRMQEVYKSGLRGEPDSFIITYALGDLAKQKAGRYNTNIQYRLEGAGGFIKEGLIDTFGLEVQIERIFDIVVKTESGEGIIQFRGLKPMQPPKTYEVSIEVNTNIGKPYQVSQHLTSDLVNKEGYIMPSKNFTLKTESIDTKGVLKFPNKSEVKKGDTVLFVSDKEGSSDRFKVIYELSAPADIKVGDYSTLVIYSLSAI